MSDFTLSTVPGDAPAYMELASSEDWTCVDCGHCHAELAAQGRDHCGTPLPLICRGCGTTEPTGECARGRCDISRVS